MEIRITDADGFGRLSPKADLAIVVITRADIEAFRVGSTVERLLLFSDDANQVMRFAGRMVIQVEGYEAALAENWIKIPVCKQSHRCEAGEVRRCGAAARDDATLRIDRNGLGKAGKVRVTDDERDRPDTVQIEARIE